MHRVPICACLSSLADPIREYFDMTLRAKETRRKKLTLADYSWHGNMSNERKIIVKQRCFSVALFKP